MMANQRFSSDVRLSLVAAGQIFALSQIWPGHITLRQPAHLPVCDGEVVMDVDGREQRWQVRLVDGVQPFDDEVRVMRCVET